MTKRNIAVCIILSLITCGLYELYWIVTVNDEINYMSGRQGTGGGMVILLTIITCGLYGIYWMYQMGSAVEEVRARRGEMPGSSQIIYLLLSIFGLGIVALALMQNEVNQYIDARTF